jgi:two-component system, sensor histidine kinase
VPVQRRVLIIEDDPDTREIMRVLFELEGHLVEAAPDGDTGMRIALSSPFDVVFIDIGLPKVDGYKVARSIRDRTIGPSPCLIALTGQGIDPDDHRFHAFDATLLKPVDDRRLWALLETLPRR